LRMAGSLHNRLRCFQWAVVVFRCIAFVGVLYLDTVCAWAQPVGDFLQSNVDWGRTSKGLAPTSIFCSLVSMHSCGDMNCRTHGVPRLVFNEGHTSVEDIHNAARKSSMLRVTPAAPPSHTNIICATERNTNGPRGILADRLHSIYYCERIYIYIIYAKGHSDCPQVQDGPGQHDNIPLSLSNPAFCTSADTSDLLLASNTLILAKHPPPAITDRSSGKWLVPQVSTSVALGSSTKRVNMKEKRDGDEQLVVDG
jgi:hypothetical protein